MASRVTWQKKSLRFAAKCKRLSNRRQSPRRRGDAGTRPGSQAPAARGLPFLDEAALDCLEMQAISGIDLCGTRRDRTPQWYIRRTGGPNQFQTEGAIKNVYRGASSAVARFVPRRPEFGSVQMRSTISYVVGPRHARHCLEGLQAAGGGSDRRAEARRVYRAALMQPEKLLDRLARTTSRRK